MLLEPPEFPIHVVSPNNITSKDQVCFAFAKGRVAGKNEKSVYRTVMPMAQVLKVRAVKMGMVQQIVNVTALVAARVEGQIEG